MKYQASKQAGGVAVKAPPHPPVLRTLGFIFRLCGSHECFYIEAQAVFCVFVYTHSAIFSTLVCVPGGKSL